MIKRLLVVILLICGGFLALGFYYWNQATRLPDWYRTSESQPLPADDLVQLQQQRSALKARVAEAVQQTPASQPIKVQVTSSELNHLVLSELAPTLERTGLSKAVRGVKTEIQNGKLESGMVVNLADLPVDKLSTGKQATIARVLKEFPVLGDRPVYIGIEGEPSVQNGQVVLGDRTRIKVGDLSLSVSEAAQRLGVSEAKILQFINAGLQMGELQVQQVELAGDQLVIQGNKRPADGP